MLDALFIKTIAGPDALGVVPGKNQRGYNDPDDYGQSQVVQYSGYEGYEHHHEHVGLGHFGESTLAGPLEGTYGYHDHQTRERGHG